ncbi:hypothetical protein [Halarchaeum salinum]|uniref:Uncharacterized protein n=1 Tax=Halarchaeum salinum TaxID=489912 RepID=A0AAV3S4B0_9EURY
MSRTLAREREDARDALTEADSGSRVDALAGLTHPRSEAMFANAGFAVFEESLTPSDIAARRQRHHENAEAFLAEYAYVGPTDDRVAAFAEQCENRRLGSDWCPHHH